MADEDEITNRLAGLFVDLPYLDPDGKATGRPDSTSETSQPPAEALLLGTAFQAVASETLFAYLFQATFENVALGMALVDSDGRLRRVNETLCQMLGYARAELQGMSFQSLSHPEDWKLGAKAMRELHTGAADTARVEMRWLRKDGQIAWIDLHLGLMLDAAGRPAFFTLAALDVSKLHETALELERLIEQVSCLSDISQRIDQRPELEPFFEWLVEKVPRALRQPEMCMVAVEYQGLAYGDVEAMITSSRITQDLIVSGETVGWLYAAYSDERIMVPSESTIMKAIGTLVNSYLEIVRQQKQLENLDDILTRMETAATGVLGPGTSVTAARTPAASTGSIPSRKDFPLPEAAGEKRGSALRRFLRPKG